MMTTRLLSVFAGDVAICVLFYTRLPLRQRAIAGADLARAGWAAPLAGAIVGALGGLVYALARLGSIPALPAAALALAATMVITGGLHEDGLADVADGLGGTSRERRLEIMRDSRIGTFGCSALLLSLLLRTSALASIAEPLSGAAALVVAHAAARATIPAFMRLVPPARRDGLSAGAGRAPARSAVVAALLGLVALGAGLGAHAALLALIGICLAGSGVACLCVRQFEGQTGDVLGAVEQVAEIAVLLAAARL